LFSEDLDETIAKMMKSATGKSFSIRLDCSPLGSLSEGLMFSAVESMLNDAYLRAGLTPAQPTAQIQGMIWVVDVQITKKLPDLTPKIQPEKGYRFYED